MGVGGVGGDRQTHARQESEERDIMYTGESDMRE